MKTLFVFILLMAFVDGAFAQERLGAPQLKELHVKSFFKVGEGQEVEFGFDESYLAFGWLHSPRLSTHFMLGSQKLINPHQFFVSAADLERGLALVEGYVEYQNAYGQFRAGLVPLQFGEEGSYRESQLYFERSLLFQNRAMGLRDLGLSYSTNHNGYYTDLTIHNGEGTQDNADSRLWFTAKWGWSNSRNFNLGVAAQTGTTKPESTSTSGSTLANIIVLEESKFRIANFFTHWYPNNWEILLEAYYGTVEQDPGLSDDFMGGHFDFGYKFSDWILLSRFDLYDPSESSPGDLQKRYSAVIGYSPVGSQSTLYLEAIQIEEESQAFEQDNNEIRIVWRMTPFDQPTYR